MMQEDFISILSSSIREPLLAVDGRGIIVSSNDDASRMLARDDRGLVGKPLGSFLWGDEAGALDDLLRSGASDRAVSTARLCRGCGMAQARYPR